MDDHGPLDPLIWSTVQFPRYEQTRRSTAFGGTKLWAVKAQCRKISFLVAPRLIPRVESTEDVEKRFGKLIISPLDPSFWHRDG